MSAFASMPTNDDDNPIGAADLIGQPEQPALMRSRAPSRPLEQAAASRPLLRAAGVRVGDEPCRDVCLPHEITSIANRARSVKSGLHEAMGCFCQSFDWSIGHTYIQSNEARNHYVDSGVWWLRPGRDFTRFIEASRPVRFCSGHGLIGEVIQAKKARWIDERIDSSRFLRAAAAREAGLRCGVALPVLVGDRVAGVIEFFADHEMEQSAELLKMVEHLGVQLGRLVERTDFAREIVGLAQRQQRKIGTLLQEAISQQLAGIALHTRSLQRALERDGSPHAALAETIVGQVGAVTGEMRSLAIGLSPAQVAADMLVESLEELAQRVSYAFDLDCRLESDGTIVLEDGFRATELFYITREAVYNAARHSGAGRVTIRIVHAGDTTLSVQDDGCGFDTRVESENHIGLRILQHRAALIDARLTIDSQVGGGTTVTCILESGV